MNNASENCPKCGVLSYAKGSQLLCHNNACKNTWQSKVYVDNEGMPIEEILAKRYGVYGETFFNTVKRMIGESNA